MGNRKSAGFGGDANGANLRTISDATHAVNQYDGISQPGIAQLLGHSPDPAAITATPGQQGTSTKQGNFWRAEISAHIKYRPEWHGIGITYRSQIEGHIFYL